MDANFPTPALLEQPEPSPSYGLAAYEEELTGQIMPMLNDKFEELDEVSQ